MGYDVACHTLAEGFVDGYATDLSEDRGITLDPDARKRIADRLAQEIQDLIESVLAFETALLVKQEHEARRT